MDVNEVASRRRSLGTAKGNFTRTVAAANDYVKFAADKRNRTPQLHEQLLITQDKLRRRHNTVEEMLEALALGDTPNSKDYEDGLDEAGSTLDLTMTAILASLADFQADITVPAAPAAIPVMAPLVKPNEALKPERLAKEATPVLLHDWIKQFTAYYDSSRMNLASIGEQQAYFFACLDSSLGTRLRTKIADDLRIFGPADVPSCIVTLKEEFLALHPIFMRRLEFERHNQASGQLFTDWIAQLKQLGGEADLADVTVEDRYMMRYITGTCDEQLRRKFLEADDPTQAKFEDIARAHEYQKTTLRSLGKSVTAARTVSEQKGKRGQKNIAEILKGKCWRCGAPATDHKAPECPHKNRTCNTCNTVGHLARVCMKGRRENKGKGKRQGRQQRSQSQPASRQVSRSPSPTSSVDSNASVPASARAVTIRTMPGSKPTPSVWLDIKDDTGKTFSHAAIPDSGAGRSILSYDLVVKHGLKVNRKGKELLRAANGEMMKCEGSTIIKCTYNGLTVRVHALLSSSMRNEFLLSWQDMIRLRILPGDFPTQIQLVAPDDLIGQLTSDFSDVFAATPAKSMAGPPMHIYLDPSQEIVGKKILTTRQVPLHQQDAADALIQQLVADGVLARVQEPTKFISRGFFVNKPGGGLRLVTDYQSTLNPYVLRPVHPFPSSRDILKLIMPDARYFAKLDAVQGYLQIPLDEESSLLTTFLLPSGRYRYLRAPMGLNASSDEWCSRSDAAIQGLEGVLKLVDDILVLAPSLELLETRLRAVLTRCRENGITISKKKFQVGSSVKFAGYIVSSTGVEPDPDKVLAISDFPAPKDLTGLRSFLGLANQLGHFIPDLTQATEPMRQLLHKGVAFQWLPEHQEAFQMVKNLLTSPLLVHYFDPKLRTELLTDASRLKGLGYALIQRGENDEIRLIQCGSTVLTPAQKNYATIELEGYAVKWAIEQCYYYLKGAKHFTVVTDHRPLLGLFRKQLGEVQNRRLQSYREDLADYTFDVTWVAGKTNLIADALSRAPVFDPPEEMEEEEPVTLCLAVAPDPALQEIYDAAEDEDYCAIVHALKQQKSPRNLPPSHPARPYSSVWSDLAIHDDVLLRYGDRIVVPQAARKEILRLLHVPHAGIVKTRKAAQQLYYWPGLNNDIVTLISACSACQRMQPSQPQEPLQTFPVALAPMERISLDIFDRAGHKYLVLVDRFSGFPLAHRLRSENTSAITKQLTSWFRDFGRPKEICTDGGPQFRSDFDVFCSSICAHHVQSSPYHPRSNGLAEAAVKQTKHLLIKCEDSYETFLDALAEWRNVPRTVGEKSPAELFFNRRPRGRLPTLSTSPYLAARDPGVTSALPVLSPGDRVWVQHPITRRWDQTGEIISMRDTGRSYIVSIGGKEKIRNRRFLRKMPATDIASPERKKIGQTDCSQPPSLRRSSRLASKKTGRKVHFAV